MARTTWKGMTQTSPERTLTICRTLDGKACKIFCEIVAFPLSADDLSQGNLPFLPQLPWTGKASMWTFALAVGDCATSHQYT